MLVLIKKMLHFRYRKDNLYTKETGLTGGPMDDTLAIFVTDFDVAFSLQVS